MSSGQSKTLTFTLSGETFTVSHAEVEDLVKHVAPRPQEKYGVKIGGRYYPPKQVVGVALGLPVARFTTMDATRILGNLGFVVEDLTSVERSQRNDSEQLFEIYLRAAQIDDFAFEKAIEGTARRPDYVITRDGADLLFEVKEFRAEPSVDSSKPAINRHFKPRHF